MIIRDVILQQMTQHVLILGGRGRIGSSVALDLLRHTDARVTVTGRPGHSESVALPAGVDSTEFGDRLQFLPLDLADQAALEGAIAALAPASSQPPVNLVIHCAGPFHHRDTEVLQRCIQYRVNYLDVSDSVRFTRQILEWREAAIQAGITAVINTGIFPGISNSMVRQGVEQFDEPEEIHLSYVVGGSGGAGLTVMRTTFLGLMYPFKAWVDGQWQVRQPYSDRQSIPLPPPYYQGQVYWYEMPETFTLAETFPVKTVVTKFGSVPGFYNHLTWIAAHIFPKSWIQNPAGTEFLSRVSYWMTRVTDPFSGIGVGIRSEVTGRKQGQRGRYVSTLVHENTAIAAGYGTGSIAQLLLSGALQKPGVWPVEAALPTDLFEQTLQQRQLQIQSEWANIS